jgi:hypothetical protein
MKNAGKYAKLAILATLCEPKSLSELGIFWYDENGRFYKIKAQQEIRQVIHKKLLIRDGKKFRANTEKLINSVYSDVKNPEVKKSLLDFWSHPFTQKTYLCCSTVKSFFSNNPEKASETSLGMVLNLPLILHKIQDKDSELYSAFIGLQNLESYAGAINKRAEDNLQNHFKHLSDKTDWLDNLNKIIRHDGFLLKKVKSSLKINKLIK